MRGALSGVIAKLVIFTIFTVSVTGLLLAVIGNIQPFTDFYDVKAEFSDATGLLRQDVVKAAGVTIGKVAGAEVDTSGEVGTAVVTLQIAKRVDVPQNVRAAIRFRNLIGQRMVVLDRDRDDPVAPPLPKDGSAVIPLSQTSPAFDLGIVFNNLGPVLATFDPEDVNTVARATVQIFAGREERVQQMVSDLADLAETLADRGPVVQRLITELNTVLTTLARRDTELRSILTSFDQLMSTLAGRSAELVQATDDLGFASGALADLVQENRPGLDRMIGQLQVLLAMLAEHKAEIDAALEGLPKAAHALNRATTYGEWSNLTGVCLNGACESGFSSEATNAGLSGVFSPLLGGR